MLESRYLADPPRRDELEEISAARSGRGAPGHWFDRARRNGRSGRHEVGFRSRDYAGPETGLGTAPEERRRVREGKGSGQARIVGCPARPRGGVNAPVNFIEWEGVKDEGVTPSDSTGAVGPSRYVELVNLNFAIYDRSTNQLSTGTLNTLAGRPETDFIFDPQVIWDPQTQRFYYAMDDTIGNFANSLLAYGWSKTDTPTSAADFFHFTLDYPGDLFPDYPKLGDSFSWGARRGQHVRPARLRFRQFRRHVVPQAASRVHLQPAIRRADDQPSGSVWYADIHAHPRAVDRPPADSQRRSDRQRRPVRSGRAELHHSVQREQWTLRSDHRESGQGHPDSYLCDTSTRRSARVTGLDRYAGCATHAGSIGGGSEVPR